MGVKKYIRPHVQQMAGYHLEKRTCDIKLDQNETPFDLPEDIKKTILDKIGAVKWGHYPDYRSAELTAKIAEFAGVSEDQVLVGHGSNSLILTLLLASVSADDSVLLPAPSFSLYGVFNQILAAKIDSVALKPSDFSLPVDEILAIYKQKHVQVTILCSPNNPTGNAYSRKNIEKILNAASGIVLVDEAYQEFHQENLTSLLPKYENLVILRTFSKALSMAGFRVGYLIAHKELIAEIQKTCVPYNVNVSAQIAVSEILNYPDLIQKRINTIIAERQYLWLELQKLNKLKVYPSDANFFLMCAPNGQKAFQHFLEAGILVRDVSSYPGLNNCLRFNIGTPQENRHVLQSIKQLDELL